MDNQFNQYDVSERANDTQGSLAFDTIEPTACDGNELPDDNSLGKHGDTDTPEGIKGKEVYRNSKKFYEDGMAYISSLSEEEKERILRDKNRSLEERNAVIVNNIGEALSSIHWKLSNGPIADCDDELQAKLLAVVERFHHYKAERSEFSQFAHTVMSQQLSDFIARNKPIRLPRKVSLLHHKVTQAKNAEGNEGKTESEIISETLNPENNMAGAKDVATYKKAKADLGYTFISLQAKVGDSEDSKEFGTTIQDKHADIFEDHLFHQLLVETLLNAADLEELEELVLTDFYYLGYKMDEIAERRGISSVEKCRSIQQRALRKLRKTAKDMGIKGKELFSYT